METYFLFTFSKALWELYFQGVGGDSLFFICPNWEVAQQKDMNTYFGSMQFLTSKVYLYITTVQSESLACKIGVLHIYNRYTIIYYHNKIKANKKNKRTTFFKYFKFLTIFTTLL